MQYVAVMAISVGVIVRAYELMHGVRDIEPTLQMSKVEIARMLNIDYSQMLSQISKYEQDGMPSDAPELSITAYIREYGASPQSDLYDLACAPGAECYETLRRRLVLMCKKGVLRRELAWNGDPKRKLKCYFYSLKGD